MNSRGILHLKSSSQCPVYIHSCSPGAVCGLAQAITLTERQQPASCATCLKILCRDGSIRTDYKYGISAIMAFQPKAFITPWPQLDCLYLI